MLPLTTQIIFADRNEAIDLQSKLGQLMPQLEVRIMSQPSNLDEIYIDFDGASKNNVGVARQGQHARENNTSPPIAATQEYI